MKKFPSPFKALDRFIFKGVDSIKALPQYQQLMGQLDSLPDDQLKIINQGLSYLLIVIPFFIIIFSVFYNLNGRSNLTVMNDMRSLIDNYDLKKREAKSIGRSILGRTPVNSKAGFESLIRSGLRSSSISTEKVTISGGVSEEPFGEIQKTTGSLTFKKFSSKEFADLLNALTIRKKIRITRIETNLNRQKSMLSGSMELAYYGKFIVNKEEEE